MKNIIQYYTYRCINGLVDVAIPVVVEGDNIANIFSGQFFFEKPDICFFKEQAKIYGFDEKTYLETIEKVPVVSKEKVEDEMNLLLLITQMKSIII